MKHSHKNVSQNWHPSHAYRRHMNLQDMKSCRDVGSLDGVVNHFRAGCLVFNTLAFGSSHGATLENLVDVDSGNRNGGLKRGLGLGLKESKMWWKYDFVNVMLFNPKSGLFRIMNVLFQKPRTSSKSWQVSRMFQYRFVNRGRPMRYLWDTFRAVSKNRRLRRVRWPFSSSMS